MASCTFQASQEIRDTVLARLHAHAERMPFHPAAFHWAGQNGSVTGVILQSSDSAEWELRLGLPRWLGFALDTLGAHLAPGRVAPLVEALGALPLGRDIDGAGSLLVCELLRRVACGAPLGESDAAGVLRAIVSLHQQSALGADVAPVEWRQVRHTAIQATDAASAPDPADPQAWPPLTERRAVCAMLESAGWDPRRSPSCVAEVLRHDLSLQALRADQRFGWSAQDDAAVQGLLDQLYAEHLAGRPDDTRTVFELLERHHPDTDARLRARTRCAQDADAAAAEQACRVLQGVWQVQDRSSAPRST